MFEPLYVPAEEHEGIFMPSLFIEIYDRTENFIGKYFDKVKFINMISLIPYISWSESIQALE